MADWRNWMRERRPTTRRLVQLYAALLYNANLKGFVDGAVFRGGSKVLCAPGLNCYSCPGAVAACPLGALQNALAASGHRAGWYVLGMLLLFGVTLGRTVCGWLCPMGMIQELLHRIPTPKLAKSRVTRALSWLKYGVLAAFVVALPLWYGLHSDLSVPAFCKYICPAGTFEGAVGLLSNPNNAPLFASLGQLFTQKFAIMIAAGLACVFVYRAFCRFLCPLGAVYGLFNRFSLMGVKVDAGRCNRCGACVRNCEMDVRCVGDRECIACGKCMAHCAQGAISMKCGRLTLMPPATADPAGAAGQRRRGHVAWIVALAALALVLIRVNIADASPKPAEPAIVEVASDAPVGFEVGQRLADFSLDLIGGGSFTLSDHLGKPVFINLWATYCAPCVQELPLFDRLLKEHPDIEVLAVHSALVTDDVAAYLSDKGWRLDFAVDTEDEAAFRAVNGSATLPQTIVLNRRGEVVYNQVGAMRYEQLTALLEQAEAEPK